MHGSLRVSSEIEPQARSSVFDRASSGGLFNLISVLMFVWMFRHLYENFEKTGCPLDLSLFAWFMDGFLLMLAAWLALGAYVFLVHVVILLHIRAIRLFVYFAFQVGLVLSSIILSLSLPISPLMRFILACQTTILFMKVHSFFITREDMITSGKQWDAVSLMDFGRFLFFPTLIFHPAFPRKRSTDWGYVARNWLTAFCTFSVVYVLIVDFIYVELRSRLSSSLLHLFVHMGFPTLGMWLLLFYGIFHGLLNGWAEAVGYADCEFYLEWWDSRSFGQFWRLWNRIVYKWMLRHVYLECQWRWNIPRQYAMIITFVVTALMHEFAVSVAAGVCRGYLFFGMVAQVSLIYVTKMRWMKQCGLGNTLMWLIFAYGNPVVILLYCHEYLSSLGR